MASVVSWCVTLFLVGLIVLVIAYGVMRPKPPPPEPVARVTNVEVSTVRPRPYRERLELPARLEAQRHAAVAAEFGGRLARWLVGEGATVAQGQVVAELDTAALEAQRAELLARKASAEAAVARAEAGVRAARVAREQAEREVVRAEAALEAARSALTLAQKDHERAERLVDAGVLDRAALDRAVNGLAQARAAVRQAEQGLGAARLGVERAEAGVTEAERALEAARAGVTEVSRALDTIEVQLAKSRIRAPIPGRLDAHRVEPGEVVAPGQELARIYDLSALKAVVDVPERFVAFLEPSNPAVAAYTARSRPGAVPGVRARVTVPGLPKLTGGEEEGLELSAEVVRVGQAADPVSNTFPVELRVPNPQAALRQGHIARAEIEFLTYPEAIVIPSAAVQVTDQGPRVLVVEEEGGRPVARVRDLVPASIREDEVLVLEGLAPGDRLIVAGWKGLVSGQAVRVVVEDGAVVASDGGGTAR
ncbi:MAG: multidrug efflux RND transporter periplasmic adaptor subunit AcrA [Deferrisoma sp.]